MNEQDLDDRYRTYVLQMTMPRETLVEVGALAEHRFSPGCYLYIGSARSGLEARLKRHHSDEKRKHWHIDYLLEHARITSVYVSEVPECRLNGLLHERHELELPVRYFGSSDCDCQAHLAFLSHPEEFGMDELNPLDPDAFR